MENKKPILPAKLPPNERKKLSLLIDTQNEQNEQNENHFQQQEEIVKKQDDHDNENRFSGDNNAYFIEHLIDENELCNTDDSSTADSNSYYVLNDFISKDISISSDLSTNINNTVVEEASFDDDDENKYFVPCGLIYEPEVIPNLDESELDINKPSLKKPSHPTLPKKMSKKDFQQSFRLTNRATNTADDNVYYCPPSELQLSTFDSFKREIYKFNKICADCHSNVSTHLSFKYFITLCDKCANIHLSLPHTVNKFYLIDIKSAYNELSKSSRDVTIESMLSILAEAGNEKINSLLEFEVKLEKRHENLNEFIRDKYLKKAYINTIEIDYTTNYIDNCNQTFSIQGMCIPIIIYNLFLGANLNYTSLSNKTAYDLACESNSNSDISNQLQINYFKLNNALSFNEINTSILINEFEGDLLQVLDMNPTIQNTSIINNLKRQSIRINLNQNSIRLTRNKAKTDIIYSTLIKIESHFKSNLIEVKWCNKSNNSLMSTYFEYSCLDEKNIWMFEFYLKLLFQLNPINLFDDDDLKKQQFLNLIDLIRTCQINLVGYLNWNKYELIESERDEGQLAVVILIETLESQLSNFFHRKLILIDSACEINVIDLRKIRIKFKDNLIRIDYENKCFVLKSYGYLQNLKAWYETLMIKSQMNNLSINDQYLTRENVPVFIEKICSHVEFNFILEKLYYNTNQIKMNKNFDLTKYLKEKELDLITDDPLSLFKQFFSFYFTCKYFILFIKSFSKFFDKSIEQPLKKYLTSVDFTHNKISYSSLILKSEQDDSLNEPCLVNLDKLKSFLYKQSLINSTFYNTLRRIVIHLNLVSTFKDKNNMSIEYLSQIFATILFSNTTNLNSILKQSLENLKIDFDYSNENITTFLFSKLIETMTINCVYLFNLKDQYLKTQLKMIDRSFELNKIKLKKQEQNTDSKYLITIYYETKTNEKAYNLLIDSETTPESLINSLTDLKDLKNLSLFEIFDNEQYKLFASRYHSTDRLANLSLVRLLPLNLKLINNLSKWNSFYLCLKQTETNTIKLEANFNEINYEKCEFIIQCKNCGFFNQIENSPSDCRSHKWKYGYFLIENNTVKLFKRCSTDSEEDYSKLKQLIEFKLNDLIIYYGVYYWSEASSIAKNWQFQNEIKIAEDECLSLFDKRTKLLCSIHLKDNISCLSLYKYLFERLYEQNCSQIGLFLSKSNPMRHLNVWISDSHSFSTNSIGRILKKIIKK